MSYNTPEGKVKKKVVTVLKKHGVWYFFPANNGFGKAGIPDLIAIVRGQFLGIEVKADKTKKPTMLQVKCGQEIQNATEEDFRKIRRKCGLVFQLPALLDSRSLFENLCFGIRSLPLAEKARRSSLSLTEGFT